MATEESLTFRAFGEDASAGRMFDRLDDRASKASRSVKQLDHELSTTEQHLKALGEKYTETGDKTLLREFRAEKSHISMLQQVRKELDEIKPDGFFTQLSQGLEKMPINPYVLGLITVAAAAAAPTVGAIIGGAVLGGVGVGGIVGAVALAAQDDRVKTAGSQLGTSFFAGLKDAARPAISPTIAAIGELGNAQKSLTAELASGFAKLAPTIKPLAEGITGMIRNLGPGLDKAFTAAEPAVRAIANELPEIGSAISDMLTAIADSPGAQEGLITFLHLVEEAITGTGDLIGALSDAYDWMVTTGNEVTGFGEKYLGWIPGVGGAMRGVHDETQSVIDDMNKAQDASHDFSGALADNAKSAKDAADQTKAFDDAIKGLLGTIIGHEQAQINYQKVLADTKKELHDGARTLDITTEAGRKNREQLLKMISTIEALREANLANNMPIDRANGLYVQQLSQLQKLAEAYGFNRGELDKLIGTAAKVPQKVGPTVTLPGVAEGIRNLERMGDRLDKLDGRTVKTYVRTIFGEYRAGERNPQGRASGGPTKAGRMYLVGENGPELWTETANGYVHDTQTTKAMLSGASGGSSAAVASGAGAPSPIVFPGPTGDFIFDAVLRKLRDGVRTEGGGDVDVYFGSIP